MDLQEVSTIVRIMKNPEERKEEIINAAEDLFVAKGYENTSVNDIVNKVGVAKGLFYYYFKAKEELLNAISQKYIRYLAGKIRKIAEDEDKNAVEKIHQILETIINQFGLQNKGIKRLAKLFNNEKNSAIHKKMADKMAEQITPHVISIFKQGVRENLFETEHPEFIAETLLMWAVSLHNTVTVPITDSHNNKQKAKAAEDMIERLLGAEQGSLNLFPYFIAIINELERV